MMASRNDGQSDSSESSSASGHDKQEWEDLEPDQEETEFISLFDEEKFTSIKAMLEYTKDKYHFDFAAVQDRFGMLLETLPRSRTDITRKPSTSMA
jgi:protein arginine N-methyltransferase 3